MSRSQVAVLIATAVCVAAFANAQPTAPSDPPLANWTAPPYWTPPPVEHIRQHLGESGNAERGVGTEGTPETTLAGPLPFFAVNPCRLVDTRNAPDHPYSDGETRVYDFSTNTNCTGLPSTPAAWSLNVFMKVASHQAFLSAWPDGMSMPVVATLVAYPTGLFYNNAAIVPAGNDDKIDVYCQYAADVAIDINGYYAAVPLVEHVNTLSGDVTLAPGSNVDISPSGNTLTISMTGAPGGTLPAGSAGQTLRSNGSGWLANSFLYNDGSKIGIGTTGPNEQLELTGNLRLPYTTGSAGQVRMGTFPLLHAYGQTSVYLGLDSGNFTTSGYQNAAVGSSTLHNLTTGCHNVAVGHETMEGDTSGDGNTAVGFWALKVNTTADLNTACGFTSLEANTTGAENTAVGASSLTANTVGADNVAVGSGALAANTTASRNTAVGQGALATQSYDGSINAWEADNTAVGAGALHANQPSSAGNGNYNTAIGADSMTKNTTGWSNTAIGYGSLWANTVGFNNTAVGGNALLGAPVAGSYNTAVGFDAGGGGGGSSNVLLGFGAGFSEIGSNRLHIANSRDRTLIWGDFLAGAVVVNDTATVLTGAGLDVNGQIRARTWSGTGLFSVCRDGNGVLMPCTSDARLKTNVVALSDETDVMAVLGRLRGVAFDWDGSDPRAAHARAKREIGFIAQEVEAVLPGVVHKEADGYRSMDYAKLTALLVEVAKEQQAEIEGLRARLAAVEARVGAR